MDEIRYALVVGAGAIGSAVAATIHKARAGAVRLLADDRRAAALARDGLSVNGERLDLPVLPARRAPAPGDEPGLVLFCVKNHQLAAAIRDAAPCVGPGTLMLSLLNGIDSEKDLRATCGEDRVLDAMILAIDAVRFGNATTFTVGGTVHFGEDRNLPGAWSGRVSRIAAFFDRCGCCRRGRASGAAGRIDGDTGGGFSDRGRWRRLRRRQQHRVRELQGSLRKQEVPFGLTRHR